MLDVINAAVYGTEDYKQIKVNIATYFEPQPLHVNPLKLWLASIFIPDITTSDHDGAVGTATFWSIARYMQQHGLADEVFTIAEP